MIRLHRPELADPLAEQLVTLTRTIGRATSTGRQSRLAAQVTEARRLWRGRPLVRTGLRESLESFASGRSRCMYCGDNQGTDIDHYEPLAKAPLRTFVWLNHLLACSGCNSRYKRDAFPRAGNGRPLLLDPTADDPFDHLGLALSIGRYTPLTERGAATIEVCRLNRDILTRGRQVAYDTVTVILQAWHAALGDQDVQRMRSLESTILEQPFADVIYAMLRYAEAPGAKQLFADRLHVLPILAHKQLRTTLLTDR